MTYQDKVREGVTLIFIMMEDTSLGMREKAALVNGEITKIASEIISYFSEETIRNESTVVVHENDPQLELPKLVFTEIINGYYLIKAQS